MRRCISSRCSVDDIPPPAGPTAASCLLTLLKLFLAGPPAASRAMWRSGNRQWELARGRAAVPGSRGGRAGTGLACESMSALSELLLATCLHSALKECSECGQRLAGLKRQARYLNIFRRMFKKRLKHFPNP